MKTIKILCMAILSLLSFNMQSQEDLQGIVDNNRGSGKFLSLIPQTGQLILSDNPVAQEGQIKLANSRVLAEVSNRFTAGGSPDPGFNSYPGTLTNVSQSGNTYILTCLHTTEVCFFYFIPY